LEKFLDPKDVEKRNNEKLYMFDINDPTNPDKRKCGRLELGKNNDLRIFILFQVLNHSLFHLFFKHSLL
jgi:hypothetical protein